MLADGAESATARGDRLEVDLRRALDQDEIEIRFQPQVSVTSGEIVGAEALARWNHPQYGELGAMTLFGVAEGSDYLVQLSDHVQRKAIGAAAAWPARSPGLRLSVNITAADMLRPGFAASFLALVASSGFDPARLTVEVTESGLIEDLAGAAALLAELRGGGLRVAIDDFGTGYSSLAYLKALPLDYLKIDKRLCQDIAGSTRDRIVVAQRDRHGPLARPRRRRRGGGDRGAIGPARRGRVQALSGISVLAAGDRRSACPPDRRLM